MEKGEEDDFIAELAWGVDSNDIPQVLFELKNHYFPDLEEDSSDYEIEEQKFRFVQLGEKRSSSSLKPAFRCSRTEVRSASVLESNHFSPS